MGILRFIRQSINALDEPTSTKITYEKAHDSRDDVVLKEELEEPCDDSEEAAAHWKDYAIWCLILLIGGSEEITFQEECS
ncbi:hypothetical protein F2Q69_00013138 [Brassica cretica]|uniref:Uncharacterized protein n=1 Tax=Brassica cretica TaxID=69181 RepID=A0A8S9QK61_BRACR|nr:hypothetical protein F2Q69_00013138 [Brassica cretica]